MEFRLYYRGPLKTNGSPREKQAIRRALHPQLRELWNRPPLNSERTLLNRANPVAETVIYPIGPFVFAALVSSRVGLVADIDILFLRRQPPGEIVSYGGDIDNRLKTLFDALALPNPDQVTGDTPSDAENPFFCLLENDVLITRIAVTTDQWLEPTAGDDVVLVLHVSVRNRAASPIIWTYV